MVAVQNPEGRDAAKVGPLRFKAGPFFGIAQALLIKTGHTLEEAETADGNPQSIGFVEAKCPFASETSHTHHGESPKLRSC